MHKPVWHPGGFCVSMGGNMIHFSPPEAFAPKFAVASCYVRHGDELLWLLRNGDKSEGNKWGVPAGKIQTQEDTLAAIAREVAEETGIVADHSAFQFLKTAYVRYPDYDYVFHVYLLELDDRPDVVIRQDEHHNFSWATPEDALSMRLVMGNVELLNHFFLD